MTKNKQGEIKEINKDQNERFEEMIESSMADEVHGGDLIKGKAVRIDKEYVVVDIGSKSEGQILLKEFIDDKGNINIKVGDDIEAIVERMDEEDSVVLLSANKAMMIKFWDDIAKLKKDETIVEGTIIEKIKGGLNVVLKGGFRAFLPGSQVDLKPVRNMDRFIGQTMQFKIESFNKKRENIVLSRKKVLEKERDELKKETLARIHEGAIIDGIVKNLIDYGAFIDIGGIDGLLHISDMSWGKIKHPKDILKVGEEIKVMILKYEPETEKISLGLKQIQPDPWLTVKEQYPVGLKVAGKVHKITEHGVFVELEEGIEGFVPVVEMSWNKKFRNPSQLVAEGQKTECVILSVDVESKKVTLGMKQLFPEPWSVINEKYKIGDKIKGKIKTITDYGLFIGIEDGIDGLVHKSDISWNPRIAIIGDQYKKGQTVEAVILSINKDEQKISLGIKQLAEDPWNKVSEKYPVGKVMQVMVTKVTDFGAFVQLEEGIEGLIRLGELSIDKIEDIKSFVKPNDTIEAEIISCDPRERKIALSAKIVALRKENEMIMGYDDGKKEAASVKLGDLLKVKLGDKFSIDKKN